MKNWLFFGFDSYILYTGLIALYLFIGYWTSHLSWKMWTQDGNNKKLAFFLFPHAIFKFSGTSPWSEDKKRFCLGFFHRTWRNQIFNFIYTSHWDKFQYYGWTTVCWPVKIVLNSTYLFFMLLVKIFELLRALLFILVPKDPPVERT